MKKIKCEAYLKLYNFLGERGLNKNSKDIVIKVLSKEIGL